MKCLTLDSLTLYKALVYLHGQGIALFIKEMRKKITDQPRLMAPFILNSSDKRYPQYLSSNQYSLLVLVLIIYLFLNID